MPVQMREDVVKKIVRDIAEALLDLHKKCGIVHRDIKPSNILLEYPPPILDEVEPD